MPKANPAGAARTEMRRADSAEAVPPMPLPPPVPRQRHIVSPRLERVAFKTSRLLDFVGRRELTAQIGHPPEQWPLVILKELVDNALDACEEAEVAPEITAQVNTATGAISVSDNGPGLRPETVIDILDYSVRVSSREAYVSPTRGAQGNALKTILAMPFALDGGRGETVIQSAGQVHRIVFAVDRIRQEPRIDRANGPSPIKNGTSVTVSWPDSACSIMLAAKSRFLQIADDFAWLNPHLAIRVEWDGETLVDHRPSDPGWRKWRACDPTSAHWYDHARLERYMAAHVARDQDQCRDRTVRDFISEFRGLSGSGKQKGVLEESETARTSLAAFLSNGESVNQAGIARLLAAMRHHTRPPKPKDLGVIGRDHLFAHFTRNGVHEKTFRYKSVIGETEGGLPIVIETAFGWCPQVQCGRRIIAGANWSVALGNPFRSFGQEGEGLESVLAEQRAGRAEPIVFVLHLAAPRIEFRDRGKTALVIAEQKG